MFIDLSLIKKSLKYHLCCVVVVYFAFVIFYNGVGYFLESKSQILEIFIMVAGFAVTMVILITLLKRAGFMPIPLRYNLIVGIGLYILIFFLSHQIYRAVDNILFRNGPINDTAGFLKLPMYYIFVPDTAMAYAMAVIGLLSCFAFFKSSCTAKK